MAGMFLRAVLPPTHLSDESKDVVKLGTGLVATVAALVLGLMVSSAKNSFDTQREELTQMSAKAIMLDHVLAQYGPEAKEARALLRSAMEQFAARRWSKGHDVLREPSREAPLIYDKIQELSPKDDAQRLIHAQALSLVVSLGQMRWLMYEQEENSVSTPLLVILIFWLTAIFTSFGLFAPSNWTVVSCLTISAMSVSCAILLILELYSPYTGWIKVSSAPVRAALLQMGR